MHLCPWVSLLVALPLVGCNSIAGLGGYVVADCVRDCSPDAAAPDSASDSASDTGLRDGSLASDAELADGPNESSADALTCVLPAKATSCCGTVACRNFGGDCAAVCDLCQRMCRQTCCAKSNTSVTCEADPDSC